MPFEAGAFELIFLAMVALIVVGPKDLPILLRKVGQWTAKMRGLAAEFRASFDEMARQSELDELRKEVEALRSGQFLGDAKAGLESSVGEINDHLSQNYWDAASSHADPVQMFSDVHAAEGDETAALPPPGSKTAPLPRKKRKGDSAAEAMNGGPIVETTVEPTPSADLSPPPKKRAPRKPTAKKPPGNAPAPEAAEI